MAAGGRGPGPASGWSPGSAPRRTQTPEVTQVARTARAAPEDGPGHVVTVGVREPRKNLGTLVRAHRRARAQDPRVPRLLARRRAAAGARTSTASRRTRRHARLVEDADDVDAAAPAPHRAGRCARRPCARASRLPVLEAMAAGTPVLASDVPAHRGAAGGTGTLLPARDDRRLVPRAPRRSAAPGAPDAGPARERARTLHLAAHRRAATRRCGGRSCPSASP